MDTVKRIAKNTIALFSAQLIISILTLLLSITIARTLGDVIFGQYSFALAFVTLFAVFSDLGYNTLLVRDVARKKEKASKYMNNIISIRAIFSIILFTLIFVFINFSNYPEELKISIYLFGFYIILTSLSTVFRVIFRAFEKMEFEAIVNIVSETFRVSLAFIVLFLGYGLIALALVFLFSGIFDFFFSFVICEKKFVKTKSEFDFNFLKNTIKFALPLSLLSIFGLIYIRIDTVMLSIIKGDAVVGWYNAAYNLILGLKVIPHLFMNALFPLLSYYYVSSKNSLKYAYEKSFKYLFMIGLPAALGISLLSDKIILLLYGQEYFNSIIALQILAWDILLIFLCKCSSFLFVSTDRQNKMAILIAIVAFINIVLNLFLIPKYSYIGAAIATIAAESFLLISYMILGNRLIIKISYLRITIKPIISSLIMGLFIIYFRENNLILVIGGSILVYFILLYLLKAISDDDKKIFKRLLKK